MPGGRHYSRCYETDDCAVSMTRTGAERELYQLILDRPPTTYCGKGSYDKEICCAVVAFIQDFEIYCGFFVSLFCLQKKTTTEVDIVLNRCRQRKLVRTAARHCGVQTGNNYNTTVVPPNAHSGRYQMVKGLPINHDGRSSVTEIRTREHE